MHLLNNLIKILYVIPCKYITYYTYEASRTKQRRRNQQQDDDDEDDDNNSYEY
jgi:hypothetical protein